MQCKSLIDEYFGDIWQLIFDELVFNNFILYFYVMLIQSPAELCGRIGLCTSSNKRKLLLKASSTSLSTRCDSCETAAKYLIKKLNDDSTKVGVEWAWSIQCISFQDNAEKQLKKFCKTLKSSPNQVSVATATDLFDSLQCEEFVDKHLEELWKEITEQIVSVDIICVCVLPTDYIIALS